MNLDLTQFVTIVLMTPASYVLEGCDPIKSCTICFVDCVQYDPAADVLEVWYDPAADVLEVWYDVVADVLEVW